MSSYQHALMLAGEEVGKAFNARVLEDSHNREDTFMEHGVIEEASGGAHGVGGLPAGEKGLDFSLGRGCVNKLVDSVVTGGFPSHSPSSPSDQRVGSVVSREINGGSHIDGLRCMQGVCSNSSSTENIQNLNCSSPILGVMGDGSDQQVASLNQNGHGTPAGHPPERCGTTLSPGMQKPWARPDFVTSPSIAELGHCILADNSIQLDDATVIANSRRMEGALVGRLFGRRLPFHILNTGLHDRWDRFSSFRVLPVATDCFICMFDSAEQRDMVLMRGPWTITGQVLGIDRWTLAFSPASNVGFTTPIWIRLPGLPMYCWDVSSIGRIASSIGEPLGIDAATHRLERGGYARACVKCDLTNPLKGGVWVNGFFGRFFQKIEYEGVTQFCFNCGHVGHKASHCSQPSIKDSLAAHGEAQKCDNLSNKNLENVARGLVESDTSSRTPPCESLDDAHDSQAQEEQEQHNPRASTSRVFPRLPVEKPRGGSPVPAHLGDGTHSSTPVESDGTYGPWMIVGSGRKKAYKFNSQQRQGASPTQQNSNVHKDYWKWKNKGKGLDNSAYHGGDPMYGDKFVRHPKNNSAVFSKEVGKKSIFKFEALNSKPGRTSQHKLLSSKSGRTSQHKMSTSSKEIKTHSKLSAGLCGKSSSKKRRTEWDNGDGDASPLVSNE